MWVTFLVLDIGYNHHLLNVVLDKFILKYHFLNMFLLMLGMSSQVVGLTLRCTFQINLNILNFQRDLWH